MKYAKRRYTKKLANGGYTGAIVGASGIAANIGASELNKKALNADGTYDSNKIQGAQALQYGSQGAAMGSQFGGPVGTILGAGLGAAYGIYKGTDDAIAMNKQVDDDKIANQHMKTTEGLAEAKRKAEEQKNYNAAYNNINPTTGQQGATLYAKGGKLRKLGSGGFSDPPNKLTQPVNLNTDPTKIPMGTNAAGYNAFNAFLTKKNLVNDPRMNTNEGRKEITDAMINEFNSSDYVKKFPTNAIKAEDIKKVQQYHKMSDPNVVVDGWVGSQTSQMKFPIVSTKFTRKNNDPKHPDYNVPIQDSIDIDYGSKKYKLAADKYNAGNFDKANFVDEQGNMPFKVQPDTNISTFEAKDGKTRTFDAQGKEIIKHAMGGYTKAPGGQLNNLASDTVKVEGNTHAEGGVKLMSNGSAYAEVEDNEVIKGTKVFSDRIKFEDGESIADKAEKFAKLKGKNERNLKSPNYRENNSATRTSEFADRKLDELFRIQEASKNPVNNAQEFADGGDFAKGLQMAVPYIDNIYNNEMIKKTPDVPLPTEKQAYYAKAMPMKTTYDVSANIADANNALTNFNKNIDDNSSSSNVGRSNKLAAFASSLTNKNAIYQNKTNIETQLENANNRNIQDVNNSNMANAQSIANTNLSQKDQYNYAKMQRQQDILNAKSANISNAVNDATTQIGDYNASKLDSERIMLDADKYTDGSGYAKMIGSKTMDDLVKNNNSNYKRIEKGLTTGKQEGALQDFYKRYGKR